MRRRTRIWSLMTAIAAGAVTTLAAAPVGHAQAASDQAQTGAPAIEPTALRIQSEVIYAAAGKPVTLFHFFAVTPDCGRAAAELTVTSPPAHGDVRFAEGAEPPVAPGGPIWSAPDPRARCAGQLVATRDAIYQPAPGFFGHDRLTVEFRAAGETFDDAIEVNVVKLGGPQPDWEHQPSRPAAKSGPTGG